MVVLSFMAWAVVPFAPCPLVAIASTMQTEPPSARDRRVPPPVPQPPTTGHALSDAPRGELPGQASEQAQNDLPTNSTPLPFAVRHIFLRQHDRNNDGRLDPTETPRKRFVKQFAKADQDGDGFLNSNEILFDRNAIGKAARALENFELDSEHRLVLRGGAQRSGGPTGKEIAIGVLNRLDRNKDGAIVGPEIRETIRMDLLPLAHGAIDRALAGSPPPPPPGGEPVEGTQEPLWAPKEQGSAGATSTDANSGEAGRDGPADRNRAPPPPMPSSGSATAGTAKTGKGGDSLPTAKETIEHLDKNGDRKLSTSEAVDQLSKNFKTLDKNRDGLLDEAEIDRGLRLARMFGIKPMRPTSEYSKDEKPAPNK